MLSLSRRVFQFFGVWLCLLEFVFLYVASFYALSSDRPFYVSCKVN